MKLSRLLAVGVAGYATYQVYKNRQAIKEGLLSAKKSSQAIKEDVSNIKVNLAVIQDQKEQLKAISEDLSYKFRVFNQETQSRLEEIHHTMDKYQMTTNSEN